MSKSRPWNLIAIGWFLFTLLLFLLPGSEFPKPIPWMQIVHFDKWVHAGIFGLMTWLFLQPLRFVSLTAASKRRRIVFIISVLCIWGLMIEVIQDRWIPFRSFEWEDWLSDMAGVFIGLFIFYRQNIRRQSSVL